MTRQQRDVVQATGSAILSDVRFADRFYDRLFALAPETRHLFRDDLSALKLKFLNTLASLVGLVERPDMFRSILHHLGRQHGRFGVEDAHYGPVGLALEATLAEMLGERFTADARDGWAALYAEVARHMKEGAREDR